jgi:hypothetical protein
VLFPYGEHLFGRPDASVKYNATDSCQMFAVLVERLKEAILFVFSILIQPAFAIFNSSLPSRIGFPEHLIRDSEPERTERSRSFLFFSLAALAVCGMPRPTRIYIPENALISLNIPLDPLRLGAFSTRTTHPFYIARFNEMLTSVGISSRLDNPYRHMTKGEMVSNCKDKALLERSHTLTMSCSSASKARWKGLPPSHCGHCVPCIIRRAALAKMSIPDATIYVTDIYARPLNSMKAEGGDIRSFQFAIHRLRNDPSRARVLISRSYPNSSDSIKVSVMAPQ